MQNSKKKKNQAYIDLTLLNKWIHQQIFSFS